MHGVTLKITASATFVLISTSFLPALVSANTTLSDQNKANIYSVKRGCMACHQGEAMQLETSSKSNKKHMALQNQAKTIAKHQ